MRILLLSPRFSAERRLRVLRESLGHGLPSGLAELLVLLAKDGLAHHLPSVAHAFSSLARGHLPAVKVVTAAGIDISQRQRLEYSIRQAFGDFSHVEYSVDASLLAGAIVRVGDLTFDRSLRTRLEQLRQLVTAQ